MVSHRVADLLVDSESNSQYLSAGGLLNR